MRPIGVDELSKKSILQSIKPQHCANIAAYIKKIEVRKSKPNIPTPFNVYIYCTKGKSPLLLPTYSQGNLTDSDIWQTGNGKVIGEYVCNDIDKIVHAGTTNQNIELCLIDNAWHYTPLTAEFYRKSCLSYAELEEYSNGGDIYGWHISDLVIYDKPKELYDFIKPCTDPYQYCQGCEHGHINYPADIETSEDLAGCCFDTVCLNRIRRAPQSWCYVEKYNEEI